MFAVSLLAVALLGQDPSREQILRPFVKRIEDIGAKPGPLVAHILMRAPICTKGSAETGVVKFPVPTLGVGQAPLAYRFACLAPGKLLGCKWRERTDGRNLVCDVTVQPGTKGAWVQYDALVLLGKPAHGDTDPPASATEWKQSTSCVQSSSARIRAIAEKLAASGDSAEAYARKVMAFVRDDMGKGAPFKALDALAALECGGSCTNKSNLAAALLRAHGIPARTVSHMPLWATEPLYEHWLTEFWQPGEGWLPLDATIGCWNPDRRSRVVLAISNPADEDRAFEPLHERFVMPGAAYMSVAELSKELYPADLTDDDAMNSGNIVSRLVIDSKAESALFAATADWFTGCVARSPSPKVDAGRYDRVLAAAKTGSADNLMTAIRS